MEIAEPLYGEIIEIPWGPRHTVRATVHEVYGQPDRRHLIVILTPEVSGYITLLTSLPRFRCPLPKSLGSPGSPHA